MSLLKFTDGINLDTDGKLRISRKPDGLYVLGQGMSIPVDSQEEGEELIKKFKKKK